MFTASTLTAVTAASKATVAGIKTERRLIDTFRADNVAASALLSPKTEGSTATDESWKAIRGAVVAGFDASVQKLLALPTDAVRDTDKPTRRYWHQQIGSIIGRWQRALAKDEAARAGVVKNATSPVEKLRDAFTAIERAVQKETAWGFDVDDFLRDLRALNKRIC